MTCCKHGAQKKRKGWRQQTGIVSSSSNAPVDVQPSQFVHRLMKDMALGETNPDKMRGYCEGLKQDGFDHPDISKIANIASGGKHKQNLWRALRNLKAENPLRRAIIKFRNRFLLISMILISEGVG